MLTFNFTQNASKLTLKPYILEENDSTSDNKIIDEIKMSTLESIPLQKMSQDKSRINEQSHNALRLQSAPFILHTFYADFQV